MAKKYKILLGILIVIVAVVAFLAVIIIPRRMEYIQSDEYQYELKCAELKKTLKDEYNRYLSEMNVKYEPEDNILKVTFYETGSYFEYAYKCKLAVEDYINTHPDFFVHELQSKVWVASKTDEYLDYEREFYYYSGVVNKNGNSDTDFKLNRLIYLTDRYDLAYNNSFDMDIIYLKMSSYCDFDSAIELMRFARNIELMDYESDIKNQFTEQQVQEIWSKAPDCCSMGG